jgi:hypothetical protein
MLVRTVKAGRLAAESQDEPFAGFCSLKERFHYPSTREQVMVPTSSRFSSPAVPAQNHATQPACIVPGSGQAQSAPACKPEWQRFSQCVVKGVFIISGEELQLEDIRSCAEWLKTSPAEVHTMVLCRVGMDAAGAALLSEALKINTTLVLLALSRNLIGNDGAASLSEALEVNTALAALDLGWNNIGDVGMEALSKALGVNTSLTSLNLVGNEIGPDSVMSLSKALELNRTLASLNFQQNLLDAQGIKALAKAMAFNKSLHTLVLTGSKSYVDLSDEESIRRDLARNRLLRDGHKAACVGLEFASGLAYPPELMPLILNQLISLPSIAKQDAVQTMESCIKSISAAETTAGIAAAMSDNAKPAPGNPMPCTLI